MDDAETSVDAATTPRRSPRRHAAALVEPRKSRVACNDDEFKRGMAFVKSQRSGSFVRHEERVMILHMHLKLRNAAYHNDKKNGSKKPKRDFSQQISNLTGRSKEVCRIVWSEWLQMCKLEEKRPGSNKTNHATKFKYTFRFLATFRSFIRFNRISHQLITCADILQHLRRHRFIHLQNSEPSSKEFKAALRLVQRTVHRLGYIRARKNPNAVPAMPQHIIEHRNRYLRLMHENREAPDSTRRRLVYTDESYIHHNYNHLDRSIIDPTYDDSQMKRHPKIGRRYCFVAALVGPDLTVAEEQREGNQHPFILKDSIHIFQGGEVKQADGTLRPKPAAKITKDYHGMFDSEYYIEYMGVLLNALDDAGVKNTYILMDNASYHKTYPEGIPKGNMTKAKFVEAAEKFGFKADPAQSRIEIWQQFRRFRDEHIPYQIQQMARDRGHEIVYTPPYHCEIQPIERVWAQVKNKCARQHNVHSKFADLRNKLQAAFEDLSPETLDGIIKKSLAEELQLHNEMKVDDDAQADQVIEYEENDPCTDAEEQSLSGAISLDDDVADGDNDLADDLDDDDDEEDP